MSRANVVYEVDSGLILSVHETPTQCDEELASYYRTKRVDDPTDRLWNQITVPDGTPHSGIVGTRLGDW